MCTKPCVWQTIVVVGLRARSCDWSNALVFPFFCTHPGFVGAARTTVMPMVVENAPMNFFQCDESVQREFVRINDGGKKKGGGVVRTFRSRLQETNGSEDTTLAAATQSGTGPVRGTCLFVPRFLLHHIIFDHGLIDGLGPDQPRQQENLLCRKDWLHLQRIALSEWVILPVQEVAAYPWCSECEHLRSGTCREERRAKWAHVGWSPWHRCANKIDGPCPGCPDSFSVSEPEHGLWSLDDEAGRLLPACARISPLATAHRAVRPRPGSLCKGVRLSHCGSPGNVTSLDAIPQLGIHFAPCRHRSSARRQYFGSGFSSTVPAMWLCQAVGSRGSRTESPGEELACASRPPGTQHGRKRHHLEGSCGTPRPKARWCPRSGREEGASGGQLSPTQPIVRR